MQIQQAVETLRDPVSRAKHDELLNLVHPRILDEDEFEFPQDYTGWRPHVYMGRSMHGRYMYSYGNSVHMDPNSRDSFEERSRWERMRQMFGEEIRERAANAAAAAASGAGSAWQERMGVFEERIRRDQEGYQGGYHEAYQGGEYQTAGVSEEQAEEQERFFQQKEYEETVDMEEAQQQWYDHSYEDDSQNGGQYYAHEYGESPEAYQQQWYAPAEPEMDDRQAREDDEKAAFWEQQDRYEKVDAEKCRQRWDPLSDEEEFQSQVNPASDYDDYPIWEQQPYESGEEDMEAEYAESLENEASEEYGEHEPVQPAAETEPFQGRGFQTSEYETANQSEECLVDLDPIVTEEPAVEPMKPEVNLLDEEVGKTTATTSNDATSFYEARTAQSTNVAVPIPNPQTSDLTSNSSLSSKISPLAPYFVNKLTDSSQRYTAEDLSTELKGIVLETYCGWLENLRLSCRDTAPTLSPKEGDGEGENENEAETKTEPSSKHPKTCTHLGYWEKEYGSLECTECGRWKPVFVLVCPGCGIRRCVGCKFSGWEVGDGHDDDGAVYGGEGW